ARLDARTVVDRRVLPARAGPPGGPADGAGAALAGARAAECRQPADHDRAAVLDRAGHDDRPVVAGPVAPRHVGTRPLEDQTEADGPARRRERGDLGPARPAAAGAGGPGPAARPRRDAEPGHRLDRQRALGVA